MTHGGSVPGYTRGADTIIKNRTRLFVAGAKAYAMSHGKTMAIAEFSNLSGPFVRDDLYIFFI